MSAVASAQPRTATRNRILFLAGLAVAGLLLLVVLPLVFVWPRNDESEGQQIELGSVDGYEIGSITPIIDGKFYLVRPSEETFLALSWREPGRGCTIPWRPDFVWPDPVTKEPRLGWFRDPCRGSTFDREGHRVFGPAPRDMDRYLVTIVNDRITVDTSRYICGFTPPGERCEPPAP